MAEVVSLASHQQRRLRDRVLTGPEIIAMPPPKPGIGALLSLDSLAVIFGPSGSGKSFIACNLAHCVTAGRPFFGNEVVDGPVLYVAAESPFSIGTRFKALHARHGSLGPLRMLPTSIDLLDHRQVAELLEVVADQVPALVVVDTFARCVPGADENSAQVMGQAISSLDQVRAATGATVLLVHHSGKDQSKGLRGSSAIFAAVDSVIKVEPTVSGHIVATVTKQRDGATGARYRFALEPEGDTLVAVEAPSPDDSLDADEFRPTELMSRVVAFLGDCGEPVSQRHVEQNVRGKAEYLRQAIKVLLSDGTLVKAPGTRGAHLLALSTGDSE